MRKQLLRGAFAILGLMTAVGANAQQPFSCGNNAMLKKLYADNPQMAADYEHLVEKYKKTYKDVKSQDSVVYVIPIVFHIVHEYGTENITDAQVYNQMDILNKDFRKLNADTLGIVPSFIPLMSDAHIEFRLATIDPYGNCTNGIEHIYSHQTNGGDDYTKINQWHRNEYLNVWVTRSIGEAGVAGYAYYPTATQGGFFFADGILILHDYIGSTGTGSLSGSIALTHEIGHYLGLAHVWGNTNDPNVACGDDGVDDTPITKGHENCPILNDFFCDNNPIATTYNFDNLTTSSGTTDPTPEIILGDSALTLTAPIATGVSTNSETASLLDFSNWGTGALDSNILYSALTGSINTTKYYQFTVSPTFGQGMTLTSLAFNVSRDTTGIRTYAVRSSKDNYASNLSASITPSNADLSIQAGNIFYIKNDNTTAEGGSKITLTGANFSNQDAPITFRIYGFNSEDANGTFGVDNIALLGSFGTIENVQNYMEYSYCPVMGMYTHDQADFMENVLLLETAGRNNLYTDSNRVLTGTTYEIGDMTPLCPPVADFSYSDKNVCIGQSVAYKDASWRAGVTSWSWSFPGGTPSTSTSANPTVVYNSEGHHDAILTVTNAAGSDTKTIVNAVYISPDFAYFTGPYVETYDNPAVYWYSQNPENNHASFNLVSGVGIDGSKCWKLNNYKDVSMADPYTTDWYYYNRLGGSKDYLISAPYNLSYTTGVTVSFDYAYGTKAATSADVTEQLKVYSSKDCGETWSLKETIQDADLLTVGYVGNTNFAPNSNTQWKTATFNYSANSTDTKTRFRFEFVASDNASNLYIDNFNVTGVLGIEENGQSLAGITISPNPINAGSSIEVGIQKTDVDMIIDVVDVNGAIISTTQVSASNGTETVLIPMNVSKGCYFVKATQGAATSTNRVIVF